MKFTPQEMTRIERMRRWQRLWPRYRWLILVMGLFMIVAFIPMCVGTFQDLHLDEAQPPQPPEIFVLKAFNFQIFYVTCIIAFVSGSQLIVLALAHWHGNINHVLLLKLLDAQQKQTSGEDHAT